MRILVFLLASLLFSSFALAGEPTYIGTNKCKSCHKKEDKGAQYKQWTETKHAEAFAALSSEKALAIAAERKMTLPPNQSPKCLKCHTTGFENGGYEVKDEAFFHPAKDDKAAKKAAKRMVGLQNVGCESCHGPGSKYKGKKKMRAIFDGEADAAEYGLTMPDEKVCLGCHNDESPTFESFDFKEKNDEINHPFPEKLKKQKKTK